MTDRRVYLNDLSMLPPRPLTVAEVESLDTRHWTLYECNGISRIPASLNIGYFWRGDELWGNINPQTKPLDAVQIIFYRDIKDGVRVTQPIEVVPTEKELRLIAYSRYIQSCASMQPQADIKVGAPVVKDSSDLLSMVSPEVIDALEVAVISDSARQWVKENTREYRPDGGMLGRGKAISVDEALSLLPALQEAGFVPYRSQWTDNSRLFPVYANDGGITATVWHGFVREINGKHEIVAIEHWNEHMADFKARTGLTLVEVMECPHLIHATEKY